MKLIYYMYPIGNPSEYGFIPPYIPPEVYGETPFP